MPMVSLEPSLGPLEKAMSWPHGPVSSQLVLAYCDIKRLKRSVNLGECHG